MDEKGDYESMERFLPSYQPIEPIDMKFGPEGDLYVLEYGNNWFKKSDNARLTRIEYNAGNRVPLVEASVNVSGGSVPLKINLSSAGTKDYDGDELKYEWKIKAASGAEQTFTQPNPSLTLSQPDAYTATLTVTDAFGATNSKSVNIIAGNEPPQITLNIAGNRTFFFPGQPLSYNTSVNDKEDGKIDPKQVALSINYASEGFDPAEINQQQRSVDASTQFSVAKALIMQSDCKNCHKVNSKSIGPMFTSIANKYQSKYAWALDNLPKKIREGGSGVWGNASMPAHPAISLNDARTIVNYIMKIRDKNINTLPLNGNYVPEIPISDNGNGSLIIRAAYTDKGALKAPPLTAEKTIILRTPYLNPASADVIKNADIKTQGTFDVSINVIPKTKGYIGFKSIDLTGIKQLELKASANMREGYKGGLIEVHLDKPNGELIGQAEVKTFNLWAVMTDAKEKKPDIDLATLTTRPAIKVEVKNIQGQHDLYFVFKNDKAKSADPLMSVSTIKFDNTNIPDEQKKLGQIIN
jgi:cytochrome c